MTTPETSTNPGTAASETRRLRLARRLLDGAGLGSLVAYRHDPDADLLVLAHALTRRGDLVVVCTVEALTSALGEEVVGDRHDVRLDLHREAATADVRILVSSLHLLGRVEWVSIAEQRRLVACGELPEPARDAAWSDRNRVGRVCADRVVLHDSEGVAAWSFEVVATTPPDPSPWAHRSLEAVDAVMSVDQHALAGLCRDVSDGRARGRVLARRPVGAALAAGRRVHCLDADASGVTLLHVDGDTETVVFAGFPEPVAEPATVGSGLGPLLPRSRS
ncbi:hypothetical protein [Mobilicoccus massiliensis]|uniref:hypothetical protein n=1 Tax=Mobilicoccus massiliensis TaxID=1522310 RepID=UPI00058B126D|nr:hypothetical protein [Mobilicoccus massiliensis]